MGYTTWAPLGIDRTKSDSVGRRVRYFEPDDERRVLPSGWPTNCSWGMKPAWVWNCPPSRSVTR